MTHLTAAQARTRDQKVLGNEYGGAYHRCVQALWELSSQWDRYETLFGSKSRVELLNKTSGHFWYSIQNTLFDHVLLGLCRLTDPPRTGAKKNLTLAALLELDSSRYKAELRRLVSRAERSVAFARSWRNKRIAHNDYDHLVNAVALAPATRRKVRASIIAIHDVLRWICAKHFKSDMYLLPLGDDDTNEMMLYLADGVAAEEARRAAITRRDFDFAPRPIYPWLRSDLPLQKRYEPHRVLRIPKRD